MDVALSRSGAWLLRGFFFLVVVFLYAPIVILLIFSFNNSNIPAFPSTASRSTGTARFLGNPELQGALKTSAVVAALSSLGAVLLGILASIALVRRSFRGKSPVSAFLLSPLVIPYLVFGISLLLLFQAVGFSQRRRLLAAASASRDRTHRDQPPLHDPRADAPAPADRRLARGSRV